MMHRLAVLVLAAVAGALAVPGSAAASVPPTYDFDVVEPITIDPVTGAMSSSVPDWATSGNCTMFPDSTVVIAAPDRFGHTTITWSATMFTNHTDNGDIWHMSFFLQRADGRYVTVRGLDSPLMRSRYTDYTFDVSTPTVMPQDQFAAAAQIEWMGNC